MILHPKVHFGLLGFIIKLFCGYGLYLIAKNIYVMYKENKAYEQKKLDSKEIIHL